MSIKKEGNRVYGRRLGRPLNSSRQEALDALMPELGIEKSTLTAQGDVDPAPLFSFSPAQTWLEIGFGNGEHVKGLMERYPERGFIAAEPFINGMSAFLKSIEDTEHKNVRVWMDDAIILAKSLTGQSLDGIYVLNPDPWPKTRHHKRRIISKDTLDVFARILKPGGKLIMATDVDDLAEWMAEKAVNHPAFSWTAENADDWRVAPKDWIYTRYEKKGEKAGRKQTYLIFEKI